MGGLPQRLVNFDAFADETYLHPAVAWLLAILCILALCLERRFALIPILVAQNFVTWAQRVSVLGLDFTVMRVLICVSILRIAIRREYAWVESVRLDRIIGVYIAFSTLAYSLQLPGAASLANALGTALDSLGGYFVARSLLRDERDLRTTVVLLMWTSFVIAALFLVERRTGRNPFGLFGGVPSVPEMRESRMRVQGPYPHPILAGAYWAAAFPLFVGFLRENGKRRAPMLLASLCSVLIIVLCASSTPLMSLAAAMAACLLYFQRDSLRFLKVAAVAAVVGLALVMDNPVWYIFAKIDLAGGSTGYHRFLLIDQFLRHWREWLAIGVRDTFHWGQRIAQAAQGLGLADLTNQFVSEGVRGGLLSLVAFASAIATAFGYIGTLLDRAANDEERRHRWHLAAALATHVLSFLGVSYFGQVTFAWWMALALCGSLFQTYASGKQSGFIPALEPPSGGARALGAGT